MGIIKLDKNKIANLCDKTIEIFIYVLLFSLPFSKAIIEIAAAIIILAWLAKQLFKRRVIITYLNLPILFYILANFLSVPTSTNFALSLKNFGTKLMEYIMLFLIISELVKDKKEILKNICIVMISSAAMIGIDCIFQFYFGFDFLRFHHLEAGRITGSFQMPGDLAGYLGPVLCLVLVISFLKLKRGIKYFLRIEALLLLSLLFVSFARGAWLGLIAAICFLGLWEDKKIAYLTAAFLLILAVITPCLIPSYGNALRHLKEILVHPAFASSTDRKTIWEIAIRMIKDRPIFGQGLSTFMGNFVRFGKDYYYLKEGIIPYAHNCYLQIAAETGIVGLASFLWLIGAFLIHTIRSLMQMKNAFLHAVLSGISAGLIITLIHSAVDTNLYSLQLSVLFWAMLGINAGLVTARAR